MGAISQPWLLSSCELCVGTELILTQKSGGDFTLCDFNAATPRYEMLGSVSTGQVYKWGVESPWGRGDPCRSYCKEPLRRARMERLCGLIWNLLTPLTLPLQQVEGLVNFKHQ